MQIQHPLSVEDLSDRPWSDGHFLGVRVGIPALDDVESVRLPSTHFSVLQRPDKRLAAVTALGMDGTRLIDLDRSGIPWRLNPRLRGPTEGMALWLGLESYLQDNAGDNGWLLALFTGANYSDTDPVYRGVQIPLKSFRVASFMRGRFLAADTSWTRHPSLRTSRTCPVPAHSRLLPRSVRPEHSKSPSQ